uniref:PPM-type phosphatase domain-containing protein n=2 Tax=Parascaris univalens TaxID=6257 RepID=A0A915A4D4_PARUN
MFCYFRPMTSVSESFWFEGIYQTCHHSATGSVPSVVYKDNGDPIYDSLHHKSFRLVDERSGKEVKLYGIIDASEDGMSVAEFVAQRLINEILPLEHTGSHIMNNNPTDAQIIALLHESFQKVDRAYFSDHIGETLARRCALQMYPSGDEDIEKYNAQINGFATAAIALLYDKRLFVANLGDSRAIIVKQLNGDLSAIQMSKWHDPTDVEERVRLSNIRAENIEPPTRCFGDFFRKGGYKENPSLKMALCEPVIAEPSVHGSLPVDDSLRFLILVNGGMVHSIMEENPQENVNIKIASLVAKEFVQQRSMPVMARAVVDCIAREHQDAFTQNRLPPNCKRRREMVMTFCYIGDFALGASIQSSTLIDEGDTMDEVSTGQIPVDDHGRVAAYVDFSAFESHPLKADALTKIAAIMTEYADKTDAEEV